MFKPVSRASNFVITPPLRTEDPTAEVATANRDALAAASLSAGRYNGTVQLPGGRIYLGGTGVPALVLDERHAGLVLRGAGPGKTVLVPTTSTTTLSLASRLVDGRSPGSIFTGDTVEVPNVSDYAVDEVIYFWTKQNRDTRAPQTRTTVTATSPEGFVTFQGDTDDHPDFMHVKGFIVNSIDGATSPIVAGATAVRVPDLDHVAFFAVGDDVLLGDGPGLNEFRGEWLTIAAVNAGTGDIAFTTATVQEYEADLACLVPGYQPFPPTGPRQHMSDITLRDLSVIASDAHDDVPPFGLARAGLRLAFENVAFVPRPGEPPPTTPDDFAFTACGRATVRDLSLAGRVVVGPCQNLAFDNLTASAVRVQEYARDCVFSACRIDGPGGFTVGPRECAQIDLTNCTVRGYAATAGVAHVGFAADSVVTGLRLRQPLNTTAPVLITATGLRLTVLAADSPVTLAAGSSGVLLSPLAAGQIGDGSGNLWGQPLTVRADGVVRVPPSSLVSPTRPDLVIEPTDEERVGLKVRGLPNQEGDLTQWLNEDVQAAPLFAVRADGNLATSKSATVTAEGSIVLKLQLFDVNGAFLGYIPIYDTL